MISVEEARGRILDALRPTPAEVVALAEAWNRVTAQDVAARLTQPPADVSAMDGYALRADDGVLGARVRVVGAAPAGHPFEGWVGAGEAVLFARVTPDAEEAEVQLMFINFSLVPNAGYTLARHPGMMINFGQCRPDSRGTLRLRSPEPGDKPLIQANYLSAPSDQDMMLRAARLSRRIGRTGPLRDMVLEEIAPTPDLEDDEALLDHLRATATTVYHPCGTCRMGADDAAVVDPQLRVRGVAGLRVADASVMPLVPSSNIQPAVMMVAERAADFIRAPG